MGELSRQQRLVFSLRFYEDRSLAEIAEMTGLRIGSVKSHLFRATRRLRAILAPAGRSGEDVGS
jgi:RNA polymerase sigma-70 factor (ECF subfamily)